MKKWIIAAALVVAVLLVAPVGLGKIAEKRVNAGLDKLVEAAPYVVIAERSWTGGWFRSRQTVTFELAPTFRSVMDQAVMEQALGQVVAEAMGVDAGAAAAPGAVAADPATAVEPVEQDDATAAPNAEAPVATESTPKPAELIPKSFTIHNDVLHGPVLGLAGIGVARLDTTFDLPAEVVTAIRKVFGEEPAATLRTRLGFFSGATSVLVSQGRTLQFGEEGELVYDDLRLVANYDADLDDYSFDGKLPRVEARGKDGGSAVLSRVRFEGDGERVMGDLYDVEAALKLGEVKVAGAQGRSFTLQDVHYVASLHTDDDFSKISVEMGTGDVETAEIKAMDLEIEEIHYDFSFRRLHAETLARMITSLKQFYAAPGGSDPDALADALSRELFGPLKENALALLTHDPEFSFDRVGVVTGDGEGVMKGVIKLVGVQPEDLSLAALGQLLNKIEAQFTIEVAQPLIEKIPNGAMMSGMAVDTGYATRDGDKLVSRIQYRAGVLTINGKQMPVPGLGGVPQPELTPVNEGDPAAVEL